jgi:4-diphosphocytidyl-2-C-methyl-D-erythritol kinase
MTTAVHSPIVAARVGIRADASRAARRAPRVQARVPASRSATFSSFASPRRGALAVVAAAPADAAADEGSLATSFFSPSKVNLFLRIIRRREDGYHDLASLFHVIDLGDDMKFAKSSSKTRDTLVCSDDTIPLDESNLVIKALDLFRRKTGIEQYFWVELEKKVPHGAGLGGGSGNAATAMWAANVLCGAPRDGGATPGVERRHRVGYLGVLFHGRGVLHRQRRDRGGRRTSAAAHDAHAAGEAQRRFVHAADLQGAGS